MELLEREPFLEALGQALAQSRASGRIALVLGEAGIGKTSLVDRFAASVRSGNRARVLWGACDSLLTPQPLAPLDDIAASLSAAQAAQLRAPRPAEIFAAFLAILRASPTLVILEDLHWADEATLDLVKFLGRRIHLAPALLVLTYRDDELRPRHPLRVVLGDLASKPIARIELPPLSAGAVGRLAGAAAGVDAAALHRQTGGNPFYVTEVLASGGALPPTVRDAVLARAARLGRAARAALETAAVIGARADLALLGAAGAPSAAVDECAARGVLRAQGQAVAFRHELARQAVLDAIAPQRLRGLHGRVLAALRAGSADPARLAHHAEMAGDGAAVREFAPHAARLAAAAGAHREAAAQYARALRVAAADERAPLLEACAEEHALVDALDAAIAARREALALRRAQGDRPMEGDNLARLAWPLVRSGRNAEAEAASREAIAVLKALPASRQLASAYRVHAHLRMLDRDSAAAVAWGRKAIALARRLGDSETVAMGHLVVGTALLVADDARGTAEIAQSRQIAETAGLDSVVALGFLNLGSALGEMVHLDAADRALSDGIAYVAERDLEHAQHYMLAWQALVRLQQGRWAEAGDIAAAVVRRPVVSAISRITALIALGRLRARRGDPDAMAALDEALALAARTGTLQRLGPVRAARAEAAWLAGDPVRAAAEAGAAYDLAARHRHAWFGGELAFWRAQAGTHAPGVRGPAPRWLAEPYGLQIKGAWRKAAAAWERRGCPYERARALAEGDEPAQREALAVLDRLGARAAADALRRRLRARGLVHVPRGPRPATRENAFGLTGREMEILAAIAEGLSNAAIAARLRISPKTVDHHVCAVLAKLAVPSRAAAARLARERGLLARDGARDGEGAAPI